MKSAPTRKQKREMLVPGAAGREGKPARAGAAAIQESTRNPAGKTHAMRCDETGQDYLCGSDGSRAMGIGDRGPGGGTGALVGEGAGHEKAGNNCNGEMHVSACVWPLLCVRRRRRGRKWNS